MGLSRKQSIIVGIILAVVGLLSPFYAIIHISVYETTFLIYTLFLTIGYNSSGVLTIRFNEFWVILGYLPFVIFRLGVPIQFIRYYEMKTSRYALAITGLVGEIPPLLSFVGILLFTYQSSIRFSLPIHLLICAIVVYLKPVNDNEDVFQEYENLYSYDDTNDPAVS
ncbi:MAG: hypothetical protein ACTSSE_18590 [Candidatus Thorarchaeota archaeon]